MPNPKRRHSKSRRDKRRTHDALAVPTLARCPDCQEPKLPHRVCPACGKYKGREIIETQQGI
jgi:large subunit ribosomal protein L32